MTIYIGDALETLKKLPSESVQCCVTSPPYWGLRDYGVEGQMGLEGSLQEHILKLVEVFREVKRVLRNDGTFWLNYGDAYASTANGQKVKDKLTDNRTFRDKPFSTVSKDIPAKNLLGLPWRLALALQDDGWILRRDIIWHKPNAMPESVKDRPATAHEYLFLLSKSPKYYFDIDSIKEDRTSGEDAAEFRDGFYVQGDYDNRTLGKRKVKGNKKAWNFTRKNALELVPRKSSQHRAERSNREDTHLLTKRNPRSVWTIPTPPTKEAHFATFPNELVSRCIRAGSKNGDIILDPFLGSGTTYAVANGLGRKAIGIELNPEYIEIARTKCGMFVEVVGI